MPTYRNDSSKNIKILDANGVEKFLAPGATSTTYKYYSVTGLTKTADTPYINPIAVYNELTFESASSQTITLSSPNISKIRVQMADGTFNVFFENVANTPAIVKAITSANEPIDIAIAGLCDKVVVQCTTETGTIQVIEYK